MEMLPGYEDQLHVTPDLRVYQPGTYADYEAATCFLMALHQEYYQLYFHYGSHSVEMYSQRCSQHENHAKSRKPITGSYTSVWER